VKFKSGFISSKLSITPQRYKKIPIFSYED
jgi:hypothetical protein